MKYFFGIWVGIIFVVFPVHTQTGESCSILAQSNDENHIHLTLYSPTDGSYVASDELAFRGSALLSLTSSYSSVSRIAVTQYDDSARPSTDLYAASTSVFEPIVQLPILERFFVAVRANAWSYDGRFIALHNVLDNHNDRLYIFDTRTNTYIEPTNYYHVFNVDWSPSQNIFAFRAYNSYFDGGTLTNVISDFGIQLTDTLGGEVVNFPVEEENFARFNWLTDDLLAVTTCIDEGCNSFLYNITDDTKQMLEHQNYLLEAYLPSIDAFLMSHIGDRNLFLMNNQREITEISSVDVMISRPIISSDEKYISFRAMLGDQYALVVLDVSNGFSAQIIELSGELPDLLTSNRADSFNPLFGIYSDFDTWHPHDNVLLYEDANTFFLFDPSTGDSTIAVNIDDANIINLPRWVCDAG